MSTVGPIALSGGLTNQWIAFSKIFINIGVAMGTVTATVRELSESGQTPGKVSTLLRACVGRAGVSKALKHLKEMGLVLPKMGSTPGCRVGAPKLIENSREKVGRNPRRSMGKLASAAGVSCGAMQNVLKGDLSLSPCGKTEAQLLSRVARTKELQRAKLLLKIFGDGMQPPVLWTDERLFIARAVHGHQGGWVYAVNEQGSIEWQACAPRTEASFCCGLPGWLRLERGLLFFIEEGLGVSQHMCLELLWKGLVP